MGEYIAIDIGGTFIKHALLNEENQLTEVKQVPTNTNKNQAISVNVKTIVEKYTKNHHIKGIGISTAGIVQREKSEIAYAGPTIPDYQGTNFADLLSSFELPVEVMNDVDAALLGEIWKSEMDSNQSIYCMTLGTGIGGAWYNDGLVDGAHFQGNSIGYLLYELETGTNFERRASTKALNEKIAAEFGKEISAPIVFDDAKRGNEKCQRIISEWTQEVAKGMAQIILLMDPDILVIGGGVSAQGEYLKQHIECHLPKFLPEHFLKTALKMASLQNNAALYGAVSPFIENQ